MGTYTAANGKVVYEVRMTPSAVREVFFLDPFVLALMAFWDVRTTKLPRKVGEAGVMQDGVAALAANL